MLLLDDGTTVGLVVGHVSPGVDRNVVGHDRQEVLAGGLSRVEVQCTQWWLEPRRGRVWNSLCAHHHSPCAWGGQHRWEGKAHWEQAEFGVWGCLLTSTQWLRMSVGGS